MPRRLALIFAAACLVGAVGLGGCGSDAKEAPSNPTTTSTTAPVTTTTAATTTTEQPIPDPSRDGGAGKDNGNSGSGNVGGRTGGPDPGANNYGG